MKQIHITITTTNAAFDPEAGEPGQEVARILRHLADRAENDGLFAAQTQWPILDVNGNRVGTFATR